VHSGSQFSGVPFGNARDQVGGPGESQCGRKTIFGAPTPRNPTRWSKTLRGTRRSRRPIRCSTLDPLVDRHGSRVVTLQLDVTNAAQIAAAAATAADVDLLVNNAGIVGFRGGDFTDPKWIEGGRQEMEVTFLGTFAVMQAFAPVLAKNNGGAIANLNSVASFVSFPILAAYSASKAATHSLTQATRAMLRGQNTLVFRVYPGPIDTRMGEALTLEKASPRDAARAIVAGIIAGNEQIFPDRLSRGTGPAFFANPKGLKRQVAGVPAVA
jgi:NAD(P)-dependent dehydrogenase (short-subunit alcohol dehydrogenase family)